MTVDVMVVDQTIIKVTMIDIPTTPVTTIDHGRREIVTSTRTSTVTKTILMTPKSEITMVIALAVRINLTRSSKGTIMVTSKSLTITTMVENIKAKRTVPEIRQPIEFCFKLIVEQ